MHANQASGSSAVVLVPFVPPSSNSRTDMKCVPSIRAFSSISIILGITSITLQIAALCNHIPWYSYDMVGHGIWAGIFYVIAGSLGLASASKKTRALIITTVVFASLSIPSAIIASILSGFSASFSIFYYCSDYYDCIFSTSSPWNSLEWALFGFSILAIFNSITLTAFASVAQRKRRPNTVQMAAPQAYYVQSAMSPVVNHPNQDFVLTYPSMQHTQPIHSPIAAELAAQPDYTQQTWHQPIKSA